MIITIFSSPKPMAVKLASVLPVAVSTAPNATASKKKKVPKDRARAFGLVQRVKSKGSNLGFCLSC